ncbi:MAG: DEAD/DEAH box helicase family protein [Proteobacteria bacterium]|nr:DEAD/DEAH box helicase family protein [Pseudomonadota bacterium]
MEYNELLQKYNILLDKIERLSQENRILKERLGISPLESSDSGDHHPLNNSVQNRRNTVEDIDKTTIGAVNNQSDSTAKIKLFMSLFKGRDDVYAKRWDNEKKGKSGYSPVCLNIWQTGLCGKPRIPCSKCNNKLYAELDEHAIESHLRGNTVIGIYPMLPDETCYFLAIDFDEGDWQNDISALRKVCDKFHIPVTVERSRSGKGGHLWFFFENRIPATLARKLGNGLLTCAMNKRHEINFKSYDRLFPSQDTLPKGGLGNLIALPFQKAARKGKNSEFVNENFESYGDQWAFLSTIQKIPETQIENLIVEICNGNELGELKIDTEEEPKPWEKAKRNVKLHKSDFPKQIEIIKANMLFVPKANISQKALNRLKRLASFKNPMFFKNQAMRLPTRGLPPVISCADVTSEYLCLPRGCDADLKSEFEKYEIEVQFVDKTNPGKPINVEFNGQLRNEQSFALEQMLQNDTGILFGTTAFGKTVVAINLIAERKVNTLILVDKISLLSQWKERLLQFLIINEKLPDTGNKRGRNRSIIGQLGSGKNTLNGIVDVAVMQSVSRLGEVKNCVKNYGMIIADECHHASAFNYENILKTTDAKYVYGLSATPDRKDGHHPILFMQCGPIRYRDDAKKQAEKRPFDHYIIPRFTSLRPPMDKDEQEITIQDLYAEIVEHEMRNQQIIDDVVNSYNNRRNCIVLSLRTAHVDNLSKKIKEKCPEALTLTGKMGKKSTRDVFNKIAETPAGKNIILVATGPFVGEGFDEPRLDTLFLAMPISWKGTLQQYAGRLHRLFENKKEVQIYDYIDIHARMLEKMYQKRLKGYAGMGYKVKAGNIPSTLPDIIFDNNNFLPMFSNDIINAVNEILIVSPFVRKKRTAIMLRYLINAINKKTKIIVVTRPVMDFKEKDRTTVQNTLDLLIGHGVDLIFKNNIHQKFSIMDQRIVWYGSINFLSYGSSQESIMRIESSNIANELITRIID